MSKAAELANLIGNINMGGGGVNRNLVINGAMNVAQRGTSSTGLGASSGYFTCDRWAHNFSGTAGRLTSTQDSSAPSGFANSLKLDCTTADTSIAAGEFLLLQHNFEGQNVQSFAKGTSDAKPFAVSFYVKGNASATYVCELFDADNSRQISKTFNVTTDWTRVELSFPADTTGAFDDDNAQSLALVIWLHAGSTYSSGTLNSSAWASTTNANRAAGISSFFDSTDRTFFITGVQLEVGQNPTEFEHEPFERTMAKARRYFFRQDDSDNSACINAAGWTSGGAGYAYGAYFFDTIMRAKPTGSFSGNFLVLEGGSSSDSTENLVNTTSTKSAELRFRSDSIVASGDGAWVRFKSGSGSYLQFDSEL